MERRVEGVRKDGSGHDHAERPVELTRRYPQAPWPCRRRFAARRRDARWRHPANRCPVDRACAGTRPKIYSRQIRSIGGCVPCGSPRGLGRMSEAVLDDTAMMALLKEEAGGGKVADGIEGRKRTSLYPSN